MASVSRIVIAVLAAIGVATAAGVYIEQRNEPASDGVTLSVHLPTERRRSTEPSASEQQRVTEAAEARQRTLVEQETELREKPAREAREAAEARAFDKRERREAAEAARRLPREERESEGG